MPFTKEFKKLIKNVKLEYLGKKVPKQYQRKYGKRYDLDDIKSFSYAIAKSRGIKTDVTL